MIFQQYHKTRLEIGLAVESPTVVDRQVVESNTIRRKKEILLHAQCHLLYKNEKDGVRADRERGEERHN